MTWLDDAKARAEKATPGPWTVSDEYIMRPTGPLPSHRCVLYGPGHGTLGTAEFIAHAREDVPRLVRLLEAAEQLVYDAGECPGCRVYSPRAHRHEPDCQWGAWLTELREAGE